MLFSSPWPCLHNLIKVLWRSLNSFPFIWCFLFNIIGQATSPVAIYILITTLTFNFWEQVGFCLCHFNTAKRKSCFIWLQLLLQDIKPGEDMICQQYVAKPFLIDGFKFDLRIYALVTSCDPLRIFIFNDGLGRFTTVQYTEPTTSNLVRTSIYF